jgi:hypothetical protein
MASPGTLGFLMGSTAIIQSSAGATSKPAGRRLIALVVALGCAAVLGLAAWLSPAESGVGTHEALNMPPCGWIAIADLPCPTCGMTTAFAHAANGNLIQSFQAQPLGCLLAIGTAMALLVSMFVAVTGSRLAWSFTRLWTRGSAWIIAAAVVAAWGYKIISHKGWM